MLINLFKRSQHRENERRDHMMYVLLVIFSSIGLLAASVLSYEKLHLIANPEAQLSCNFNAVFNCATVMETPQATVIGDIPNSFFGMVGFTAALTLFVALAAGAVLPRWMYLWIQGFITAGWLFALWLFFNSVYVIEILCPWCLLVTTATTVMFFGMLRVNLRENVFNLGKETHAKAKRFLAADYDKFILAALLFLLVALVILKFGDGLFA